MMSSQLSLDQTLKKANSHVDIGKFVEAQKMFEFVHENFSNNLNAKKG